MNMKRLKQLFFTALFLGTVSLFAQKPFAVTVWPAAGGSDSDNRISSLLWEYYKSELATHAKVKLIPQEVVDEERKVVSPGEKLTESVVARICKDTKADFLCAVGLAHGDDNLFHLTIRVFTADGKLKKEIAREFKAVRESDFISVVAAQDTAIAIRGENPADVINKARERSLLAELERSEETQRKKAEKK